MGMFISGLLFGVKKSSRKGAFLMLVALLARLSREFGVKKLCGDG
jgi:hypothetical protein